MNIIKNHNSLGHEWCSSIGARAHDKKDALLLGVKWSPNVQGVFQPIPAVLG